VNSVPSDIDYALNSFFFRQQYFSLHWQFILETEMIRHNKIHIHAYDAKNSEKCISEISKISCTEHTVLY